MSEPKPIGQIITEMASDPNDPVGRTLSQCPCVQALLESNGQQLVSTNNVSTNNDCLDNQLENWLDNQDVMQALHISLRSLQTLRSNGTLPYSRINNKIYYRRCDVEKLLNDNYTIRNKTHRYDDQD